MQIKIVPGIGGYHGGYPRCRYELDALPHNGEVLNLGNLQGIVHQVTHVPAKFRTRKDPEAARITLVPGTVHEIKGAR
jgi:hypothetical protein